MCPCCLPVVSLLESRRERHGFTLELIDVGSDPKLVAFVGAAVPVVTINGKVRFRGMVNPVLLDRLLEADARAWNRAT
jgi:glutaredoxin